MIVPNFVFTFQFFNLPQDYMYRGFKIIIIIIIIVYFSIFPLYAVFSCKEVLCSVVLWKLIEWFCASLLVTRPVLIE